MSAVYQKENEIIQRTRNKERLGPFIFVEDDVAWVASIYWKAAPFIDQTQFGPMTMDPGVNRPRDIVKDPEKFPPIYMKLYGGFLPKDKGNDIIEPQYVPAMERAKDIAEHYAQFGIFVPATPQKATKEECAAALKKLEATYRQWIEITDDMWVKTGRIKDGISTARIAAQHFGIEREWAERQGEQDVCPYCSRTVKSKAVKCGNANCGAILDWARAYQGGIVTKEQAMEHGVKA